MMKSEKIVAKIALYDLGNVHSQHPDGDYLCEVEDISEDYLDHLLGFD